MDFTLKVISLPNNFCSLRKDTSLETAGVNVGVRVNDVFENRENLRIVFPADLRRTPEKPYQQNSRKAPALLVVGLYGEVHAQILQEFLKNINFVNIVNVS